MAKKQMYSSKEFKIIAHRGCVAGPDPINENKPSFIDSAINLGFDVEIDLRYKQGFYLGHDLAQYSISLDWMLERKSNLWIHCKDIRSLGALMSTDLNFFWHETDTLTLTSKKFIWAYPGRQPIPFSIAVMPELLSDDISVCSGVCTDFCFKYST